METPILLDASRPADEGDGYTALQSAVAVEVAEPAQAGADGEQLSDPWARK